MLLIKQLSTSADFPIGREQKETAAGEGCGLCSPGAGAREALALAKAEDMPSVYQTAAVKNFQWDAEVYGKAVDYLCAYENEGGKRGPWSDVASLIVT
jgi:hypothetical protein